MQKIWLQAKLDIKGRNFDIYYVKIIWYKSTTLKSYCLLKVTSYIAYCSNTLKK
jgi:hypothetical protein